MRGTGSDGTHAGRAAQRAGGRPAAPSCYDVRCPVCPMPDGTPVKLDADVKPGHTWNAIGKLKGSDPKAANDVILLTAHLDHLGSRGTTGDTIFNGADDDASGSTAVLELAEAIAKGPRPKRSVMFAWFGSEESGGAVARHFLDHPPVPLGQIVANLEFEMIANRDRKFRRTPCGSPATTVEPRPELAKQGARVTADPHPEQSSLAPDNIQPAPRRHRADGLGYDALGATYKVSDDLRTWTSRT